MFSHLIINHLEVFVGSNTHVQRARRYSASPSSMITMYDFLMFFPSSDSELVHFRAFEQGPTVPNTKKEAIDLFERDPPYTRIGL